jgi:outer membrane protein assembly factor BamB
MKVLLVMLVVAVGMALLGVQPAKAASGDQLWVSRYRGPRPAGDDQAYDLVVGPGGSRVFVTGASNGRRGYDDYLTIAFDASTGSTLWRRRFDGPVNSWDEAWSVAVSPDGTRVFVTGTSAGRGTGNDYATLAYDATTGRTLWIRRYNGPANGYDSAEGGVAVSPDGSKVFVTGTSGGRTCSCQWDYATVAYDAATGRQLWSMRYDGPLHGGDEAQAVVVSPDGRSVVVSGFADLTGNGPSAAVTIAYDASTGAQLWLGRYDNALGYAATISADGLSVFVAGSSTSGYLTVAYDAATGSQQWASAYAGGTARSVSASPDGTKVFVTGESVGTSYDYATLAYDAATGAEMWVSRYDSAGYEDYGQAVAASPDGTKVFVTGSSTDADAHRDYATLAYDAGTGGQLWLSQYGDPFGYNWAGGVAASPDGARVYVTGSSYDESGLSFDYATVAYSA